MEFFQGNKGVNASDLKKTFGKPFFEVFMQRVLESYRPLYKAGISLGFSTFSSHTLEKVVRDRYFIRRVPKGSKPHFPLNMRRKRVQQILRLP